MLHLEDEDNHEKRLRTIHKAGLYKYRFRTKIIPVLDQSVVTYLGKINVHELPYLPALLFHAAMGIKQLTKVLADIKDDKKAESQSLL